MLLPQLAVLLPQLAVPLPQQAVPLPRQAVPPPQQAVPLPRQAVPLSRQAAEMRLTVGVLHFLPGSFASQRLFVFLQSLPSCLSVFSSSALFVVVSILRVDDCRSFSFRLPFSESRVSGRLLRKMNGILSGDG